MSWFSGSLCRGLCRTRSWMWLQLDCHLGQVAILLAPRTPTYMQEPSRGPESPAQSPAPIPCDNGHLILESPPQGCEQGCVPWGQHTH